MNKKLLLSAVALLLSVFTFGQKTQQKWWSGEQTIWYKNHNITMAHSGIATGDFTFDFAGNGTENGVWGVYSPGHGTFLSARPNGRVGIGTSSPASGLHIKTTTTLEGNVNWKDGKIFYLEGEYHNFKINSKNANDALFITNKDEIIMSYKGNGYIGIGTKTPDYPFDVRYNSKFRGTASFENGATFNNNTTFNQQAKFNGKASFNNVGIGTNDPQAPLHLVGNARIEGDLVARRVSLDIGSFPDYVFEDNYELMTLQDLEAFVKEHKHLPGVPSEKEVVSGGMDVAQINTLLVEKVEELTLYTIDQEKKIKQQEELLNAQNAMLLKMQDKLNKLEEKIK